MKIVAISDTHGLHEQLTLPAGDVLIHCGDFTGNNGISSINRFLMWFSAQPHSHKLLVAGNHDRLFESPSFIAWQRMDLPQRGITYLEDNEIVIEGLKFYGSPWTPVFRNWAFMLPPEQIFRKWQQIPDDVDVLITHGPPYGILDTNTDGLHCGCPHLEARQHELTKDTKQRLHLFGHLHEQWGQALGYSPYDGLLPFFGARFRFFNCSACNESYKIINAPWEIEV